MAIDPRLHRLIIGCGNSKMVLMDSTNGKVVASIDCGQGVDAAAFDPETHLGFVSGRGQRHRDRGEGRSGQADRRADAHHRARCADDDRGHQDAPHLPRERQVAHGREQFQGPRVRHGVQVRLPPGSIESDLQHAYGPRHARPAAIGRRGWIGTLLCTLLCSRDVSRPAARTCAADAARLTGIENAIVFREEPQPLDRPPRRTDADAGAGGPAARWPTTRGSQAAWPESASPRRMRTRPGCCPTRS